MTARRTRDLNPYRDDMELEAIAYEEASEQPIGAPVFDYDAEEMEHNMRWWHLGVFDRASARRMAP